MNRSLPLLLLLVVISLMAGSVALAGAVRPGFNQYALSANDDSSTGLVNIGFPICFFGKTYSSLYVNNNGNVTFDSPQSTYTPYTLLGTQREIIAPFFADVDTRGYGSDIVRYSCGNEIVEGHRAFGVNWINVGYYDAHADKLNNFQLVVIDRSDMGQGIFQFEFNFDRIHWETGDASGGSHGLGGSSARVGFSSGSVSYEMPGSGVNGALLDSNNSTGLIHHSLASSIPGRYSFICTSQYVNGQWHYTADVPLDVRCRDGCPVDLVTGEEEHSPGEDISITGPSGVTAAFARTYYTTRAKAGTMSPGLTEGWVHNYDSIITSQIANIWTGLSYFAAEGGQDPLLPILNNDGKPTGQFTIRTGAPFRVVGIPGTASGEWQSITISYPNGFQKQFTPFSVGLMVLSSITDNLGRKIQLHWDSSRHLTSIEDATSHVTLLSLIYDENGYLRSISDSANRKIMYSATIPGNGINVPCLTAVSQIALQTEENPPIHWNYQYFARQGHPLIAAFKDPSPTGQGQREVRFTYDPTNGRVATQTTANGNIHTYTYGAGQTQVVVSDVNGHILSTKITFYDSLGRKRGEGDTTGHRTSMGYDDNNNPYHPTRIVARDGKTQTYQYDRFGQKISITESNGRKTTYTYNYSHGATGRLVRIQQGSNSPITLSYTEPSGLLKSRTSAAPGSERKLVTTTYTYDFEQNAASNYGRIVYIAGPGNNVSGSRKETLNFNYTDDALFDENGNAGSFHTAPNGRPITITDKHGRVTHFRYDNRGNIVVRIDPDGLRLDFSYNLSNQLTEVKMPSSVAGGGRRRIVTEYGYPGGLPWRATTYGAQGNILRQVTTTYNINDQILSIAGNTDPVAYDYDALGRVTTLRDGKNHATTYTYDENNHIAEIQYPDNHTVQFTVYDTAGRVLRSIDGNGVTSTYSYSTNGKLQTIKRPDQPDVVYSYDLDDRLVYCSNREGAYIFKYDTTGHLLSQGTKYTNVPQATISYDYYPDGSVKRISSPAGSYAYHYNADGQLTALTNPAGRTSRWTYRADNLLEKQELGNRAWTSYAYSPLKQISSLSNVSPKGRVLSAYTNILRDEFENVTAMTVTTPGFSSQSGQMLFSYDAKSQLIQSDWITVADANAQSQSATYDAAGNMLRGPSELAGNTGSTRAYNDSNQWIGYRDAQDNLVAASLFVYDGNGNPIVYKGNHLTFNADNQLTTFASSTDQLVMQAGYTPFGLRAWKESNGQRTYYLYLGTRPLCELAPDGTVTSFNTWGHTGLLNRTTLQNNREIWYLFDPFGNVAQRADASGNVRSSDRYDAWGNLLAGGDGNDPFGYHGQQGYYTDHETGLILCAHRYFDPQSGRWLTRDPIEYNGGVNLYRYVENNTINQTDKLGCSLDSVTSNPETAVWVAEEIGGLGTGGAATTATGATVGGGGAVTTATGATVGTVVVTGATSAAIVEGWFAGVAATAAVEAAESALIQGYITGVLAWMLSNPATVSEFVTVLIDNGQQLSFFNYVQNVCDAATAASTVNPPPIELTDDMLQLWNDFKGLNPNGSWDDFLSWVFYGKGEFFFDGKFFRAFSGENNTSALKPELDYLFQNDDAKKAVANAIENAGIYEKDINYRIIQSIQDYRWLGWEKWEYIDPITRVIVHYLVDPDTGAVDDFKPSLGGG